MRVTASFSTATASAQARLRSACSCPLGFINHRRSNQAFFGRFSVKGSAGQSDDGVAIDADETSVGADAAALVEVLEHVEGLLLGRWQWNKDVPLRSEKRSLQALH
jgi:hypothetical protein